MEPFEQQFIFMDTRTNGNAFSVMVWPWITVGNDQRVSTQTFMSRSFGQEVDVRFWFLVNQRYTGTPAAMIKQHTPELKTFSINV